MNYAERLTVPLRWWVQGTMLVASFWLAFIVTPMPESLSWTLTGVIGFLVAAGFVWYGAAQVIVRDGELRAGRATIAVRHVGAVTPLDAEDTRRTAGRDADARAFLVLRPYLKRSVRVDITDPADPTPYWLVSTRRPRQLAEALDRARGGVAGPAE
ncbi:DUF3093 domain-containing protein [Nocardioides sp.]|uniref:DUF3093 domain-containing protein n=1 Tax=Nocardioides sp. TaxID=35761 RepID=UPI002736DCAE|nr:DUF3093 domain-containing protein [Nocardioides sp.]MDP3890410.1 DUF3093 domain-containing protein [Nocardioides sp.]